MIPQIANACPLFSRERVSVSKKFFYHKVLKDLHKDNKINLLIYSQLRPFRNCFVVVKLSLFFGQPLFKYDQEPWAAHTKYRERRRAIPIIRTSPVPT